MNQNPNREVGDREPRGERPHLSPIHTLVVSLAEDIHLATQPEVQ